MIKLQSKRNQLAYFAPVIMLGLGLLLYSVILPARYDKVISLINWLFSGTDNIIATLRSSDIVLGQLYSILFTKVLVWIWTIGFLFSIFWCGHTIQNSKNKNSNLIVSEEVKRALVIRIMNNAELIYRLDKGNKDNKDFHQKTIDLQTRISACGDFGYSNDDVTILENKICDILFDIEKSTKDANINIKDNIDKIFKVKSLLEERDALLKHY